MVCVKTTVMEMVFALLEDVYVMVIITVPIVKIVNGLIMFNVDIYVHLIKVYVH